jgi:hypothetical protein
MEMFIIWVANWVSTNSLQELWSEYRLIQGLIIIECILINSRALISWEFTNEVLKFQTRILWHVDPLIDNDHETSNYTTVIAK